MAEHSKTTLSPKAQRGIGIAIMLGLIAAAVWLVLVALKDNVAYFYSPSELIGKSPDKKYLRVGGLVVEGSVIIDGKQVRFTISDGAQTVRIHYEGILPDLFREGQGIIAQGIIAQDTIAQDATDQDTTAQDTTDQGTTAQDTTAQDTTAQDTTAQDTTAQDTTAQDTTDQGTYDGVVFNADTILAKHDETYMPREVADALKKRGVWKPESKEYESKEYESKEYESKEYESKEYKPEETKN